MEFENTDIHELLPQQEPFVMVGKLLHFDMKKTITATEIKGDNIFVENGAFTASGIIENIAQTCAARIGYVNKYILKKGIQLGFIGAIRNLNLYRCPRVGEVIETSIITIEEIFGMTLVTATVKAGSEIIAESEMKIALSEMESQSTE
ncbi:MAG: pseudouridylate synthase [Muribaculaceae bacterium]|nr:pseudouridylate synthase [Muribaculaceae bacterium]